jgi:alkaline phosphatase
MKTKIRNIILIIFLFSYTTFAVVKNVVVMIGDGMGLAVTDFSRIVLVGKDGKLSFEKFPSVALVRTYSYNSLVTDSAAAATALSCGIKTNNGYLGLSPEGKEVTHIVELAKKNGKSAGLVTTVSISHATPAGFSAHSSSRDELPIAEQYVELKGMVDIFLGGGIEYFIPASQEGSKRKDERNLLEEFRSLGYTVVTSKEELLTLPVVKIDKLVGVFKYMDTTYFIDRKFVGRENLPTLAEMSKVALQILLKNKKGFFLMIEGW